MVFWARIILIPFALTLIFALLKLFLLALACSVAGLILLLWKIPIFQVENAKIPEKERFRYEDRARRTLAQIIIGVALPIGLYFMWQTHEIEKKDIVTKNFSMAIEQLGSGANDKNSIGTLLGSIYTLEEIAADHPAYRFKTIEILSAYVRQNAPMKEGTKVGAPPQDISAILRVIGGQRQIKRETEPINLAKTNLQGVYLQGAHFGKAVFDGSNLSGANLREADLESASFRNSRLDRASMWKADLRGADFAGASFTNADIRKADLRNVKNLDLKQIRSSCWSNITRFSEKIKIKLKSHRIKPHANCPHKQNIAKKKSSVKKIRKPKRKNHTKKQMVKKKTVKKLKAKKEKSKEKKVELPAPVSKPVEGKIILEAVE